MPGVALEYDRPVPTGWKLVVDWKMKNPAASWREIAKAIGYSYQTVLQWTRRADFQRYETFVVSQQLVDISPEVQAERAAAMDRVRTRFESHAEEMQDRLLVLLDTVEDPKLQAQIAQDWLDRSGAVAQKTNGARGLAVIMSEEMMERFFIRTREAGLRLPDISVDGSAVA